MGAVKNIQFKRVLNYQGSMDKALENIRTKLNPALMDGEPIICSYNDNDSKKYFLAIGCGDGRVKVFPSYDSQDEFIAFIKKYAGVDLKDMISEESDFSVELDSDNRYVFKIKNMPNFEWIEL